MTGAEQLDPRRWPALLVCVTALFITLLDVSIVNVALPSIGTSTGADAAELQWVVSGYALAFGMVPIIAGRLGDDRGRKPMLLVGVGAFVVFSALVGGAPTPAVLIVGRVLQGLAGGLINPQVSGLVQQLFRPAGAREGVRRDRHRGRRRHGGRPGGRRRDHRPRRPAVRLAAVLPGQRPDRHRVLRAVPAPAAGPGAAHRPAAPVDLPGAALLGLGVFGLLFPVVAVRRRARPAPGAAARPGRRGAGRLRRLGARARRGAAATR